MNPFLRTLQIPLNRPTYFVCLIRIAIGVFLSEAHAETLPARVTTGSSATPLPSSLSLGFDEGTGRRSMSVRSSTPSMHTVKRGDTLWDVCDLYFRNPWQWPRVWALNPHIKNPHWIYPGDQIHLKRSMNTEPSVLKSSSRKLRPESITLGTVFLRNQGFLYDDDVENFGTVESSPEEKMLLTTYDKVYLRLSPKQAELLSIGDRLTAFQDMRPVTRGREKVGKVVQILGTVRIDAIERKAKFAEATLIESLDAVERGVRIGPIERELDVVSPKTNDIDLNGTVLSSVHPNVIYGQNQVVFIDKGAEQGLKPGNRLFVIRKGDPWRKELASTGALTASKVTITAEDTSVEEAVKGPADAPEYPQQVVAELRVLRVRKNTATCLVTHAVHEIEPEDPWIAKKGY